MTTKMTYVYETRAFEKICRRYVDHLNQKDLTNQDWKNTDDWWTMFIESLFRDRGEQDEYVASAIQDL